MKFVALLAVFAISIGSSVCLSWDSLEENSIEGRIIGGRTAKPGQFPHQVLVRFLDEDETFNTVCGGSIISDRWIVSAARCTEVYYSRPTEWEVVLGAHRSSDDGQKYNLSRIVIHPEFVYANYAINDISLLQTVRTIQFNELVQPIPIRKQFLDGGAKSIVTGWGYVKSWPIPVRPEQLQFLHVTTLTNMDCLSRFAPPTRYLVGDGTLCASPQASRGVCHGDFGGPVISDGKLVALTQWTGIPCALGTPELFTRISEHLKWIEAVSGVIAV